MPDSTRDLVWPGFARAFREYGLPAAIRTDNGPPFSNRGLGISKLTAWWLKLGIRRERIEPGHPEQNGRHERMHRTLKAATAKPPSPNLRSQQRRFNRWRHAFNNDDHTRHSGSDRHRPCTRPHRGRCPSVYLIRSTRAITSCARCAKTVRSSGTANSSSSARRWSANPSACGRLMTNVGVCTLHRNRSASSMNT